MPVLTSVQFDAELIVRNTFLDFVLIRSPSLEDLLPPRRVRSAPASEVGGSDSEASPTAKALDGGVRPAAPAPTLAYLGASPALQLRPARPARQRPALPVAAAQPLTPQPLEKARRPALQLAAMLAESQQELAPPSLGSTEHGAGLCRPCAFVWKGPGCSRGAACGFCHLCDAGEKQRRLKEKREFFKALRKGLGDSAEGGPAARWPCEVRACSGMPPAGAQR